MDYYRLEIAALAMSIASLIFIVFVMGFMVYRLHVIRQSLTKLNKDLEVKVQGLEDIIIKNMQQLEYEVGKVRMAQAGMEELAGGLKTALARIKVLEGMLPICATCKKIRDLDGSWHSVEEYISDHTPVVFSHGICPGCAKKDYPEYPNLAEK